MKSQFFQQTNIRRWKFVLAYFLQRNPCNLGAMNRFGFMAKPPAQEKFQMHRTFQVIVRQRFYKDANLRLNAHFLEKFPREALFETLPRLAFSAGKFPQIRKVNVRFAQGNQQLSIAENQPRRNLNGQAFPRPMLL
jgi:hypothetical protein